METTIVCWGFIGDNGLYRGHIPIVYWGFIGDNGLYRGYIANQSPYNPERDLYGLLQRTLTVPKDTLA